jgi:hypothetical protein
MAGMPSGVSPLPPWWPTPALDPLGSPMRPGRRWAARHWAGPSGAVRNWAGPRARDGGLGLQDLATRALEARAKQKMQALGAWLQLNRPKLLGALRQASAKVLQILQSGQGEEAILAAVYAVQPELLAIKEFPGGERVAKFVIARGVAQAGKNVDRLVSLVDRELGALTPLLLRGDLAAIRARYHLSF